MRWRKLGTLYAVTSGDSGDARCAGNWATLLSGLQPSFPNLDPQLSCTLRIRVLQQRSVLCDGSVRGFD